MLTKVIREKNNLQDVNTRLDVKLKDVRAQLADSVKENKRLRRAFLVSALTNHFKVWAKGPANRITSIGMLTGHLEEEMPGSAGNLLRELSQLHGQVRQVMQGIVQALWPCASLPGGTGELVEMLKGAPRRFQLWKISPRR